MPWKVRLEARDKHNNEAWCIVEKLGILKPTLDECWKKANKDIDGITDEALANTRFVITAEKV